MLDKEIKSLLIEDKPAGESADKDAENTDASKTVKTELTPDEIKERDNILNMELTYNSAGKAVTKAIKDIVADAQMGDDYTQKTQALADLGRKWGVKISSDMNPFEMEKALLGGVETMLKSTDVGRSYLKKIATETGLFTDSNSDNKETVKDVKTEQPKTISIDIDKILDADEIDTLGGKDAIKKLLDATAREIIAQVGVSPKVDMAQMEAKIAADLELKFKNQTRMEKLISGLDTGVKEIEAAYGIKITDEMAKSLGIMWAENEYNGSIKTVFEKNILPINPELAKKAGKGSDAAEVVGNTLQILVNKKKDAEVKAQPSGGGDGTPSQPTSKKWADYFAQLDRLGIVTQKQAHQKD